MTWVRVFHSAVDPNDLDELRGLFDEDVAPAYRDQPGCRAVELLTGMDLNAGGLLEILSVSRWDAFEDMEGAVASREVREGLVRFVKLLRQEPVTRIYEALP